MTGSDLVPFVGALRISPLGLGCAEIGNLHRALSDDEAQATLDAATQAGMNIFDTSPFYGHGLSELRLGRHLRNLPRPSYMVATKIGRVMEPGLRHGAHDGVFAAPLPFSPVFDYSYDGTMRALDQSRMRLGLPYPDVVLIHDLDRRNHGDAFDGHFRTAVTGAIRALRALRASGDIAAIGVAANESESGIALLAEADFDCALLAGRYTLLDQSALPGFLPEAQRRHVRIIMGGVFNSGILASGTGAGARYDYVAAPDEVRTRAQALEAVCGRYGVPLAAAALQFSAAHPAAVSVLAGASRPQTISRIVEAHRWPIPAALWEEIKKSGLLPASAPVPAG